MSQSTTKWVFDEHLGKHGTNYLIDQLAIGFIPKLDDIINVLPVELIVSTY